MSICGVFRALNAGDGIISKGLLPPSSLDLTTVISFAGKTNKYCACQQST
jgi:hypothetical protein